MNIKQKLQAIKERGSKVNLFEAQLERNEIKNGGNPLGVLNFSQSNDELEY